MLEDFQAADSWGLISATDTYTFPETGSYVSSHADRDAHKPQELFRYQVVKRLVDILMLLIAAPVVIPMIGVVAVLVALNSPGPVFFSHRRIRRNGVFFSMWKFRTMCVNSAEVLERYLAANPEARAEWDKSHKLRHDPRVTRIGRLLRRYSLDELPQVWNVLTGEMSLVGPRPIVAAEVEKYKDSFQCYCRVKPGLSGLWQVSGRSDLTYDMRVALDCEYIATWSLRRDMKILFRTFSAVVHRAGAF